MSSSYLRTSSFADDITAAVGVTPESIEGPPPPLPPPPPPPVPVIVALETEEVVFDAVLIGEGVAEAETKLNEDAANRTAVDAKRILSILPTTFLSLFFLTAVPVAVAFNIKVVVGWRRMSAVAVDKARHDVDVDGEDGGCRSGPCILVAVDAANEGPVVDEVDTEVEVIVLLLSARHDDDKSVKRVAVHAAQDAMLLECVKDDLIKPTGCSFAEKDL